MTWVYKQKTGEMLRPDGKLLAKGYAGHGDGLNNPADQMTRRLGPLPRGIYEIGGAVDPPNHLGPLAMPLLPAPGNAMFGRSAFYIHGDNSAANHTASDGCIVLNRPAREAIYDSDDTTLTVISG